MRSRRRTTQWNLFFHGVSIALAAVPGILLVPLYLKFIPLDLYGAWLATGNVLIWLTAIDPGLSTVLQQRIGVAYGQSDWAETQALLWSGLAINFALSAIILVVGMVASTYAAAWLNLGPALDRGLIGLAFQLATIGTALMVFSYAVTAVNQGLQSSVGIGLVYVIVNILSIIVTAVLLFRGAGLLAIPIGGLVRGAGQVLGNAAYLLWRLVTEKPKLVFSLGRLPALSQLISFTFLYRAGSVIANNADSFVVARFLGAEAVPALSLTRKVPEFSRMFAERPAVAFMPAVSNLVGTGDVAKARAVLMRLMRMTFWMLGLLFGGFLAFNDDFVRLWVGPSLFAGELVSALIVLGLVFGVVSSAFSNLCLALGDIKSVSVAGFIQNVVYVPMIVVGVINWGIVGVVLAPLASMLCVSSWYYPYSFFRLLQLSRQERISFLREAAAPLLLSLLLAGAFWRTQASGWVEFTAYVLIFVSLYLAGLWLSSSSFRAEFRQVKGRLLALILREQARAYEA
ncbi:MAG: MATE family efflux transporter [Chloroflexi bacterium]|nr:MATE family efflux transporter [Chloroflexota bacterium]